MAYHTTQHSQDNLLGGSITIPVQEDYFEKERRQVFPRPTKNLTDFLQDSPKVLLKITTLFPLDIFPDDIIVDEDKVTIVKKGLTGVSNIQSIFLEDVSHINVNKVPFAASLNITDSSNIRHPITHTIANLSSKDALLAQCVIQGLILAKRKGISFQGCNKRLMEEEVRRLGGVGSLQS